MAVTPFELSGDFTMEEFNSRIDEVNNGYFDKDQTLTPEVAELYGDGVSTPNDVFGKLGNAARVRYDSQYTKVTYDLANAVENDLVWIGVDGEPVQFRVASTDYQGAVLLVLETTEAAQNLAYNPSITDFYEGSLVDNQCVQYVFRLGDEVQSSLREVDVMCFDRNNTNSFTLSRSCFLLSMRELGFDVGQGRPADGVPLSASVTEALRTTGDPRWTRTIGSSSSNGSWCYTAGGSTDTQTTPHAFRPAIALSPVGSVTWYTDASSNIYIEQLFLPVAINMLGDVLGGFTQIETGSYVGTGVYGLGNPNKLKLSFVPLFLIISTKTPYATTGKPSVWEYVVGSDYLYNNQEPSSGSNAPQARCNITVIGTTVSWYNTVSSRYQGNEASFVHNWLALG